MSNFLLGMVAGAVVASGLFCGIAYWELWQARRKRRRGG